MLKLGCYFRQPKISGYVPGCRASIHQKILCFIFDLIYVVMNY